MELDSKSNFLRQLYEQGDRKLKHTLQQSNKWGDIDYLSLMINPDNPGEVINDDLLYNPKRQFGIGRGKDKYNWSLLDQTSMRMGLDSNQYISKLHGRYLKTAYIADLRAAMIFPSPLNTETMYQERFIHDYISYLNKDQIYPESYQLFLPLHEHIDYSGNEHSNNRKFIDYFHKFQSQSNPSSNNSVSFIDACQQLPFVDILSMYGFHPYGYAIMEENSEQSIGELAIISFSNTNITGCTYCPMARCRNANAYTIESLYENVSNTSTSQRREVTLPNSYGRVRNQLIVRGGQITSTCFYTNVNGQETKVNEYTG